LQDIYKIRTNDEENSSELLQRNIQLIQKFNRFNLCDKESSEEVAEQETPTHEGVPPTHGSNADLPRELRIPQELSLDNIIGQIEQGVSNRRTLKFF